MLGYKLIFLFCSGGSHDLYCYLPICTWCFTINNKGGAKLDISGIISEGLAYPKCWDCSGYHT